MKNHLFDFEITDSDISNMLTMESVLELDNKRKDILRSLESFDVQACPGSGKTTLIALKLILLAQKWKTKDKGICVLSHTNVAKNEIIKRVKKSKIPQVQSLLSYPHFIGTIQEFVNKFLGIPYLRTQGIQVNQIDDDVCVKMIYSRLDQKAKIYIDNKSGYTNPLYGFELKINDSKFEMVVPTFPKKSDSHSYKQLTEARENLISEGYLFYNDLYVFAELLILKFKNIADILQRRFPLFMIDEMQDTQKYQDELLQKIFPLCSQSHVIQRFGDPDQAIYNGMQNREANESYNTRPVEDMKTINNSFRFDLSVAKKITRLSHNQIKLEARSILQQAAHTIFIFEKTKAQQVLPAFAEVCDSQFSDNKNSNLIIKAVGAVGKKKDNLNITDYCPSYNKDITKISSSVSFFIDIINCKKTSSGMHSKGVYEEYINCTLHLLNLVGIKHNKFSLEDDLRKNNEWFNYRRLFFTFYNIYSILEDEWTKFCCALKKILNIESQIDNRINEFLKYKETSTSVQVDGNLIQNVYKDVSGIEIEITTIHNVKGETHDATLVLETFFIKRDILTILPFLIQEQNTTLTKDREKKLNKKFMKQLYVAMSRPRHLLCLAINKENIDNESIKSLINLGWNILDVD